MTDGLTHNNSNSYTSLPSLAIRPFSTFAPTCRTNRCECLSQPYEPFCTCLSSLSPTPSNDPLHRVILSALLSCAFLACALTTPSALTQRGQLRALALRAICKAAPQILTPPLHYPSTASDTLRIMVSPNSRSSEESQSVWGGSDGRVGRTEG